jgi:hypothetical protein
MAAISLQEVGTGAESLDEIGTGDATARALGALPFLAEHDNWTVERTADLASGDTDDSGMPVAVEDVAGEVAHRLGLGNSFFGDLLIDLLTFAIDGVELRGVTQAVVHTIRKQ